MAVVTGECAHREGSRKSRLLPYRVIALSSFLPSFLLFFSSSSSSSLHQLFLSLIHLCSSHFHLDSRPSLFSQSAPYPLPLDSVSLVCRRHILDPTASSSVRSGKSQLYTCWYLCCGWHSLGMSLFLSLALFSICPLSLSAPSLSLPSFSLSTLSSALLT